MVKDRSEENTEINPTLESAKNNAPDSAERPPSLSNGTLKIDQDYSVPKSNDTKLNWLHGQGQ